MEFKRLDRGSQLRPLHLAEVPASEKLDWSVFDIDGQLLAERGDVLPGHDSRDFLFAHFQPHRPARASGTTAPDGAAGSDAANADNDGDVSQFRVIAGTVLRVKCPPGIKEPYANSRVIGMLSNSAVFVSPPKVGNRALRLITGESIHLLGFSGKNIFEFTCLVESVALNPYEYLILSKPFDVKRVRLRRTLRVTTRLACWLAVGERFEGSYTALGVIRDVSVQGISIGAMRGWAPQSARVHLRFTIRTHDFDIEIRTAALVRNVQDKDEENISMYGLEFEPLAPVERLALQCFVHEHSTQSAG
jgi:c-di-GMP-binding flagellar brake protein YcgR